MKKKVLIITAIGLVLLGAVIAAALNAVFTVSSIVVSFSPVSEEGLRRSYILQDRLDETFLGKSTTFLDLEEVKTVIGTEYPDFKVEAAEKQFPNTVRLTIAERKEAFSYQKENGLYAILDEEGVYLYDKASNENRREGENILFEGFDLTQDENGKVGGEYFEDAMTVVGVFLDSLGDARANIVSVTLCPTGNDLAGRVYLVLKMREGVCIEIYTPDNATGEKATAVLAKYLSLSDSERLYGFFDIIDRVGGGFTVSEHRAEHVVGA